jgi:hypothetical protein
VERNQHRSEEIMSDTAIALPVVEEALQIRIGRKPDALIAEASLCAKSLMAAVQKNEWAINLGGKKPHLMFEAWAFLGTMYRLTARVVPGATRLIEIGGVVGFEAEAEAFHIPTQLVVSTGNAMCLNDEENWGLRPKYEWQGPEGARKKVRIGDVQVPLFQLRSMAQTRAQAKALKGPLSWIVAMAGYAPTTAEEGDHETGQTMKRPQQRQQQQAPADEGPQKITGKQGSRIWAIAHSANKQKEEVLAILKHFGFEKVEDVTVEKYDAICAEVQKGDAQP